MRSASNLPAGPTTSKPSARNAGIGSICLLGCATLSVLSALTTMRQVDNVLTASRDTGCLLQLWSAFRSSRFLPTARGLIRLVSVLLVWVDTIWMQGVDALLWLLFARISTKSEESARNVFLATISWLIAAVWSNLWRWDVFLQLRREYARCAWLSMCFLWRANAWRGT